MTHPLTDELTENISSFYLSDMGETGEGIRQDMRAAADWQLEQDAKYWTIVLNKAKFIPPQTVDYIIEEFKQAMRPQEDN